MKELPAESVHAIIVDPPYNLQLASWDMYGNYIAWASQWLMESYRVLAPTGNLAIFGGMQFDQRSGDLNDIIHYCKHYTDFRLVNHIIWYYKNGSTARRYFASRHEDIIWLAKSRDYYFDLDSVRVQYSEKQAAHALMDKRLNPESIAKGKNPTNVWEISRLDGKSYERVGHPTQKPRVLIQRLVRSLSPVNGIVLDYFAGSGTTGRVCIEEQRNCLMCDNDPASRDYFSQQLENMEKNAISHSPYQQNESLYDFWSSVNTRQE